MEKNYNKMQMRDKLIEEKKGIRKAYLDATFELLDLCERFCEGEDTKAEMMEAYKNKQILLESLRRTEALLITN